jgi:hypothetical protein
MIIVEFLAASHRTKFKLWAAQEVKNARGFIFKIRD